MRFLRHQANQPDGPSGPDDAADIRAWGPTDLLSHVESAMAIYAEAMGYPPGAGRAHVSATTNHATQPGFRAMAAFNGDRLVGFGYGYASRPGQWWHEQVRRGLTAEQADFWLADAYELCELHVRPDWQGRGIGRQLLVGLLSDVPASRHVLLSTPEGDTRAWRLYRSLHFVDVLRHFYFPTDDRPFAILAADLPLRDHGDE
jgi:ribosomal protein S18 acetylase RimI-like enzyme